MEQEWTLEQINASFKDGFKLDAQGNLYRDGRRFQSGKSYMNEFASIVEQLIMHAPNELLQKFVRKQAPWYQQARAAGLAMRYRDFETNRLLLPWLMDGEDVNQRDGWASDELNDVFHCWEWIMDSGLREFLLVDCLYQLLPIVEYPDQPFLFGTWKDFDMQALDQKMAEESDRIESLKLWVKLVSRDYPNWNIPGSMYHINPKNIFALYAEIFCKDEILKGIGWDPKRLLDRWTIYFKFDFRSNWLYDQIACSVRYGCESRREEGLIKLANYLQDKDVRYFFDEATLFMLAGLPEALQIFFQKARRGSIMSRFYVMTQLIRQNEPESFAWLLNHGFVNTRQTVNRLFNYTCSTYDHTQFADIMIDYKKRLEDSAKNNAGKKGWDGNGVKLDSASYLKKFYSWKKNPDHTLTITSYKGDYPEEISIPARIGRASVAAIGPNAFNPHKKYSPLPYRSADDFLRVKIPEGVKYIDDSAFVNCDHLKRVDLPRSLDWLASNAFSSDHIHLYTPINHLSVRITDPNHIGSLWFSDRERWIHTPSGYGSYSLYIPWCPWYITDDYHPEPSKPEV